MLKIIKNFVVVIPLFITIVSSGSFINFDENMEYNMSFKYQAITVNSAKELPFIAIDFKADFRLQKISNTEYYGQFYNIKVPKEVEEQFRYGKNRPFRMEINDTQIVSITFPSNWTDSDILTVNGMMKGLFLDRSNLTKLIESDNWKNKTGVVRLALGICDSKLSIIEDSDFVKVQAETTMEQCVFTDEEKRSLGKKNMALMDSSSETFSRIIYERKPILSPKELFSRLRLSETKDEGYFDYISELTIMNEIEKGIQRKIQLDDDYKTLSKDQILDLNKKFQD